jgi:hypothetical protein
MPCLFFDAPKNNKGSIYYKPLKMCGAKVPFLRIIEQRPKKDLPLILKNGSFDLPITSVLNSRFWLGNEALRLSSGQANLPSVAGRGIEVESQKRGLCPRLF